MRLLLLAALALLIAVPALAQAAEYTASTEQGTLDVRLSYEDLAPGELGKLGIDFINPQTQDVQEHIDYTITVSKDGDDVFGPIPITHTSLGSVKIPVEFAEKGMHSVYVEVSGILFQPIPAEGATLQVDVGNTGNTGNTGETDDPGSSYGNTGEDNKTDGGGCLIATAAYGSELAPQVQMLREIRDDTVLRTESGAAFMDVFNHVYYAFSPAVADLEREHPAFKHAVQLALAPMLLSLSLLGAVEINSEAEMLGYGISLIVLNLGMYLALPVAGLLVLCRAGGSHAFCNHARR